VLSGARLAAAALAPVVVVVVVVWVSTDHVATGVTWLGCSWGSYRIRVWPVKLHLRTIRLQSRGVKMIYETDVKLRQWLGLPWAADSCPWVGKLRTVLQLTAAGGDRWMRKQRQLRAALSGPNREPRSPNVE
jgi:hypothetical protein